MLIQYELNLDFLKSLVAHYPTFKIYNFKKRQKHSNSEVHN